MEQIKVKRGIRIETYPIYELDNNDIGKEITLVYVNGEFFTGILGEMVDENIVLKKPGNKISLGLPIKGILCYFYGNFEQQRQINNK